MSEKQVEPMVEVKPEVKEEKMVKEFRYVLAPLFPRFIAFAIDFVIFLGLVYLMTLWVTPLFTSWLGEAYVVEHAKRFAYFVSLASSIVPAVLVFFVPTLFFKNGKTLGKKIFHLRVIKKDGTDFATFMVFFRFIVGFYVIEYLTSFFFNGIPVILLLSGVFCFLRPNHQSLQDFFSGALVVNDQQEKFWIEKEIPEEEVKKEKAADVFVK